jgi:hypothetical protein
VAWPILGGWVCYKFVSLRRKKKISVDGGFMEGSWIEEFRYSPKKLIWSANFTRNQKKEFRCIIGTELCIIFMNLLNYLV